jgi:hypothetical protein
MALPPGATTLGPACVHPDDAFTRRTVASLRGFVSAGAPTGSSECDGQLDAGPLGGSDGDIDGPAGPALGAHGASNPDPAGLQTGFSVPLSRYLFMHESVHGGTPCE